MRTLRATTRAKWIRRALSPLLILVLSVVAGACSGTSVTFPKGDVGGTSCAILLASATTLDFGTVVVGQESPPVLVNVANMSACASGALSTAVSGSDAAAFVADNGCQGKKLQPGSTCMIAMHFAPSSAGAKSATLVVTGGQESASVALTGQAAQPSDITLLPAMQDFGTVVIGASSVPTTFTLTNDSATTTGLITMSVGGADQEQFVTQNDHCTGIQLYPTKSCSIDVAFAAATSGVKMATLTANIAGGPAVQSKLAGIAGGTSLVVTPAMYDFGALTMGTTSAPTSFLVTNMGGVASGAPAVTPVAGDPNCGDFAIVNSCTTGLPASGTCMFTVAFAPTTPAAEACHLNVSAPGTAPAPAVALSGVGLAPAALAANPPSKDFGPIAQGATSPDATFVITNTGASVTSALMVTLSGTGMNQFGLGPGNCSGATLNGGQSCNVNVHFAPNPGSYGRVQAQLLVQEMGGGTLSVSLSGTAQSPAALAIGPMNYGFGVHELGTSSQTVQFTVTNSGSMQSGPPTAMLGGSMDFVKVSDTCSRVPIPGNNGTCTVGVLYRPTASNSVAGSLTVAANPGGMVAARLSGTGAAPPSLRIAPNNVDYMVVTVNSASPPTTFTVSNTGQTQSGALQGASVTGANGGDFHVTADGCNGMQLGPNGSSTCTVAVAFAPRVAAAESATLGENDGQGHAASAFLHGTGVAGCPTTCPAGANCGTYTPPMAGCASINCGPNCTSPQTCGGGNPGRPNVCGCTKATSCPSPDNCGTIPDGCGGMVSCGPACTLCVANVCGCTKQTSCPPPDNCGTIPDGCGGMISCGPDCHGAMRSCVANVCVRGP